MATSNGIEYVERTSTPTSYLGKRKRSATPVEPMVATKSDSLAQKLDNALDILRQQINAESLLQHVVDRDIEVERMPKKQRTGLPNMDDRTIENRIVHRLYTTFEELLDDVRYLQKVASETIQPNEHGDVKGPTREQAEKAWNLLVEYEDRSQNTSSGLVVSNGARDTNNSNFELVSLRMQSEGIVRQLFTSLPQPNTNDIIDGRKLPNGFELSESTSMVTLGSRSTDNRTFGDVFTSTRASKALEQPQHVKHTDKVLGFNAPFSNHITGVDTDYRRTRLEAGLWLRYATSENVSSKQESRHESVSPEASTLFTAAFSSFAPSTDHSKSAITQDDRTRTWYERYMKKHRQLDAAESPLEQQPPTEECDVQIEIADDFEDVLANYVSESDLDLRDEGEKLLDEISDLIQSLSSYQTNRDLGRTQESGSISTVSEEENEIYQLLKAQLQILVNCVPPHVLAKLNGEQLGSLNISTFIPVTKPEFTGTGQADDHTLRRHRAAQTAATAAGRGPVAAPARTTYGTPNTSYNAQAQSYNRNAVPTAYGSRPTGAIYNTPRGATAPNPQFSQPAFRTAGSAYSTPTVQQFQQPLTNGYGQSTPGMYSQRPSQPGYQQRAQDRGSAWSRADSPQKPAMNGQTPQPYQNRQYSVQVPYAGGNTGTQQRMLEQIKVQQQQQHPQQVLQRPPSATPQSVAQGAEVATLQTPTVNGAAA